MKLFACSDIHGHLDKFVDALTQAGLIDKDQNWIMKDSILVLCGDYVDRGPNSKGVVELIQKMMMQSQHHFSLVLPLKGNHEQMLLDSAKNHGWRSCWLMNGGIECLGSYGVPANVFDVEKMSEAEFMDIWKLDIIFFKHLHPYVIVNDTLFVHAGVNPFGNIEDLDTRCDQQGGLDYLWIRDRFYGCKRPEFIAKYGVKRIVYGHSPVCYQKKMSDTEQMVPFLQHDGALVGIDCGSYYPNGGVCIVELHNDSVSIAGYGK